MASAPLPQSTIDAYKQYNPSSQQAINVQGYLQQRPDLAQNWNDPVIGPQIQAIYPSLQAYATDDYYRFSNGPTTYPAFKTVPTAPSQPTAPTTPTSSPAPVTPNTPLPATPQAPVATVPTAYTPVGSGNQDFSQNQTGAQSGAYASGQDTTSTQVQNTGQTQTGATTSNQTTGGQTAQTQQGQSATTTGSVTAPIDTLGFGSLLQQDATNATSQDATRGNFLTDLVQNGPSNINGMVDQAVRNSLTGAQTTGAGDDARARIAGDAASQTGLNILGSQLNATSQLAGPTATTTLAGAAQPFIGSATGSTTGNTGTQTTTGSNTGFSNLVGTATGNTTGFNNTATNEAQVGAGTATGSSAQASSGVAPQQTTTSGGGGCVLCTAAIDLGLWKNLRVLRLVIKHKLDTDFKNFRLASRGYFFLFTPLARFLLGQPRLACILYPLAKMVVYEELRVAGRQLRLNRKAWCVHWTGHYLCAAVGLVFFPFISGKVTDPIIETIARRENVWFQIKGTKLS